MCDMCVRMCVFQVLSPVHTTHACACACARVCVHVHPRIKSHATRHQPFQRPATNQHTQAARTHRWIASATASTASSCPMTRWCSSSASPRSFWRSDATSLDTGIPVHLARVRVRTCAACDACDRTLSCVRVRRV